jgi:hypothetical protein
MIARLELVDGVELGVAEPEDAVWSRRRAGGRCRRAGVGRDEIDDV